MELVHEDEWEVAYTVPHIINLRLRRRTGTSFRVGCFTQPRNITRYCRAGGCVRATNGVETESISEMPAPTGNLTKVKQPEA
jgi:hypothetical protein